MSVQPPVPPSVRLAMPAEARQVAELQRRSWAGDPLQRRLLDELDTEAMVELWHHAITRPPLAHNRVLVAVETLPDQDGAARQRVCGFAAVGPSDDPDAEATDALVLGLTVDPLLRERGHEDRLLHAVVDTLRADGYERATWWVTSTDDALRAWLESTGWAPDGAHQEVGTEDGVVRVKQVRLHTDIRPD